jgi:hypothetical protein
MPDPKADGNVATEDNVDLILRGPEGVRRKIFAASTSGSMYARPPFEVIDVGAGDSLEIKSTLEYT